VHTARVHSFSFVGTLRTKLSDIVGIINKIAPPVLAEDWDNVGLQVGDPANEIDRIMVALDPCPEAVDAAIKSSCQLLLTHHPLIFKPLKRIATTDETGRLIHKAIANGDCLSPYKLRCCPKRSERSFGRGSGGNFLQAAKGFISGRVVETDRFRATYSS